MSDWSCSLFEQPPCTACDPRSPATPLSLVNRPGLRTLRYRIGTFSIFRQTMLDAITAQPVVSVNPALPPQVRTLTCRSSDDFGVAILELWAYVCDALTFYQQAIANEGFLRTAVLRESLARLAALLGYEPARGVGATALLAFLADKGAALTLPQGLQTQSVPPPGQEPAIFETSSALTISEAGNQPVLLGTPASARFTTAGELLPQGDAGGPPVVPGSKLIFYSEANDTVAEQTVSAVCPTSLGGKLVQWIGNFSGGSGIAVSSVAVARFGRKFRHFGANAPASIPQLDTSNNTWSSATTDFSLPAVSAGQTALHLDGSYDGIAAGGRVLVFYASSPTVVLAATVTGVAQGVGQLTASGSSTVLISGSCTVLTLDADLTAFSDLRALTIFELLGDDLQFRSEINPDLIASNAATIYVTNATAIHKGTEMVLVSGNAFDVVKASAEPALYATGVYAVPITPPLVNSYQPSQTILYANVVEATQGQTQTEQILGDGDASQAWQEFPLAISLVTYVADPAAERGASSTLRVVVDDFEWTEVKSFFGRGPNETIYTTRVDEKGTMYVRFGDGVTGRRLPTGKKNVRADLRKGLGVSGNVNADTATILLQPQPGLKSVVNPLAGFGGEDPESADAIRENAPSSVITLGRAVSLRDYEALALSYTGVAKARASWGDFGGRRGVTLTAAAAGGKPLAQLTVPLRDFLDQHRDPNVPLSVTDYSPVHFIFRATLHVLAGYKQSTVKQAAEAALGPEAATGYLNFANLRFGDIVFQSQLIHVLQDVTGVDWVELRELSVPPSALGHGFGADASHLEAVYIGPREIAQPSLDDSDTAAVELKYQGGVNDLEG